MAKWRKGKMFETVEIWQSLVKGNKLPHVRGGQVGHGAVWISFRSRKLCMKFSYNRLKVVCKCGRTNVGGRRRSLPILILPCSLRFRWTKYKFCGQIIYHQSVLSLVHHLVTFFIAWNRKHILLQRSRENVSVDFLWKIDRSYISLLNDIVLLSLRYWN